ncbi:MAG: TIGR02186 family protein [Pseudomonadota bacterium]
MRPWRAAVLTLALAAGGGPAAAQPRTPEPLIADLSKPLIAITTGFEGTEVLIFGTTEGEGDVIIVLRGPETSVVVRRKSRVAGIWINTDEISFAGVPAFYRVAASRRPLSEIAAPALLARHQIGIDNLRLTPDRAAAPARIEEFRQGLFRNKQRQDLFSAGLDSVNFLGSRLFRTTINLPANVPTGTYTVYVYLVRAGQVVSTQTRPMEVSTIGMEAEAFYFAHRQAALYGIVAIVIAVLAGWAAGTYFRKA